MPNVGKEFEHDEKKLEEIAANEVKAYIERVEKKFEAPKPSSPLMPSRPKVLPVTVYDDMGKVVMQSTTKQQKPKIVLPIDRVEMERGLHYKVWSGFKWIAEWCVYMIKKYPGRVFFPARQP